MQVYQWGPILDTAVTSTSLQFCHSVPAPNYPANQPAYYPQNKQLRCTLFETALEKIICQEHKKPSCNSGRSVLWGLISAGSSHPIFMKGTKGIRKKKTLFSSSQAVKSKRKESCCNQSQQVPQDGLHVCMCVHIYILMFVHTYILVCIHIYTSVHIHTIHTDVHLYIHMCAYIYTYCVYMYTHTYWYVHLYTF